MQRDCWGGSQDVMADTIAVPFLIRSRRVSSLMHIARWTSHTRADPSIEGGDEWRAFVALSVLRRASVPGLLGAWWRFL